jgi:hypothetical protein
VQQSSYGRIDVSKVLILLEISMISLLSIPIHGLYTGSETALFVTKRLSIVWLATCPMASPVTSPNEPLFKAILSAIFIINLLIIIVI